jgi:hypothetical protein
VFMGLTSYDQATLDCARVDTRAGRFVERAQ